MRIVTSLVDNATPLKVSAENDGRLEAWCTLELTDAIAARRQIDACWQEDLRQYEGVARNPADAAQTTVEGAPQIEVTLGAIASDSVYAQFIDLLFNISPLVTVRPVGQTEDDRKDADALQRRVNLGAAGDWNIRPAAELMALDTTQLGTGFLYVPNVKHVRKTDIRRVERRGPRVIAWPIEDVLVPGGCGTDVQTLRWFGLRSWLTEGELADRAREGKWNTDSFTPCAGQDWVRSQRERLGQTRKTSATTKALYEVVELWAHVDYDGDGEDEDLYIVFDRGSQSIGFRDYNPYDVRPGEVARYQLRAHLFYGLGILTMVRPYQEETTQLHKHGIINVILANGRHWVGRDGIVDANMPIYANKVTLVPDPTNDLKELRMSEVYPSIFQSQQFAIDLAGRRVGLGSGEVSMQGRPSSLLGNRTPGITALSFLQQVNRRFTPAFDNMRLAVAGAIMQCLYREQEMLLAGDTDYEAYLTKLLGDEDAQRVIRLLRDPDFDNTMTVELTASSASVNRQADQQAAMALVSILSTYYERVLQLMQIAVNPQVPKPMRDVAEQIAKKAGEAIERAARTIDSVRDPKTFIVDIETAVDSLEGTLDQNGMMGVAQLLAGLTGSMNGAPAQAALPPPMTAGTEPAGNA